MNDAPQIRTVEIRPPSVGRETVHVLKTAFHILYWSAFIIFGRTPATDAASAAAAESPFDVRFEDLDASDQRIFRALQEGVVEAEARRARTKKWPSADELASERIPPFAPDPIDRSAYIWRSLSQGGLVNYIGTPAAQSGRRELVAIISEPAPGSPHDPNAQPDESHHRLSDGMMVHVAVYVGPGLGAIKQPLAFVNPEAGWRRVTIAAAPVK